MRATYLPWMHPRIMSTSPHLPYPKYLYWTNINCISTLGWQWGQRFSPGCTLELLPWHSRLGSGDQEWLPPCQAHYLIGSKSKKILFQILLIFDVIKIDCQRNKFNIDSGRKIERKKERKNERKKDRLWQTDNHTDRHNSRKRKRFCLIGNIHFFADQIIKTIIFTCVI